MKQFDTKEPAKDLTRYAKIIDVLMTPGLDLTTTELAEKVGISRATLWRDMKEPEFNIALNEHLQMRIKNDVVAKALSNIFEAVMRGDLSVSKWFLEYRIKLQEISDKHAPETNTIEGEFQEVTDTALAKSNGNTSHVLDLLNALERELGDKH